MVLSEYIRRPKPIDYTRAESAWNTGNQEVIAPVSDSPEKSAEQVSIASAQSASDAYNGVSERLNNGEDVFSVLLDNKYNEDEQGLKRKRTAAFLGDLANLFGQSVALSKGARQFTPIQSQVPYYNDQLSKLKNWRNSAQMNYSLTQAKSDYDMKREQQKAQLDFNKQAALKQLQAKIDEGVIDKRSAASMQQILLRAGNDKDLAALRHKYKLEESEKNNKAAYSRTALREDRADARAKDRNAKSGINSNESVVVSDVNGKKTTVTYPKEKRGAVISLYNRMKELSAASPGKYGDKLEDINLQFGEGGDQASKAMTIIQRRMQDFPELTSEFYNIVGNNTSKSPGKLLPKVNSSSRSLLPQ